MIRCAGDKLRPYLDDRAWQTVSKHLGLSQREAQIAREVFDDRKEAAIAADLRISPHTVRTHMERLYRKLGVQSRVELVVCMIGAFLALIEEGDRGLNPICEKRAAGLCPLMN